MFFSYFMILSCVSSLNWGFEKKKQMSYLVIFFFPEFPHCSGENLVLRLKKESVKVHFYPSEVAAANMLQAAKVLDTQKGQNLKIFQFMCAFPKCLYPYFCGRRDKKGQKYRILWCLRFLVLTPVPF